MGIAVGLAGIDVTYGSGDAAVHVLRGADLAVEHGQVGAVIGPSGSGKSTLLRVAALLARPDAGVVTVDDDDVSGLSDRRAAARRCTDIGFVHQSLGLVDGLTVTENLDLPGLAAGWRVRARRARGAELVEQFDLGRLVKRKPSQLSGGQQQRVAVARACFHRPALLVADEPTGQLDAETSETLGALLAGLATDRSAVLLATHDLELAARADRRWRLVNGTTEHLDTPP